MKKIVVVLMAVMFVVSMAVAVPTAEASQEGRINTWGGIITGILILGPENIREGIRTTFRGVTGYNGQGGYTSARPVVVEYPVQAYPAVYRSERREMDPAFYTSPECEKYEGNSRALSACERGVSDKRVKEQKELEKRAYREGRGE